ncbi:preprotein translocase, YajC subunit [Candidatus Arthromitus sp. SFB-mouse-Japan]|uniref:preprotein translocase subunit YajC n=1 Tax=Candidatus Arthromitus sp. SFB-mouse TaxID=49118 RepID=UPI00021B7E25|nr:preprotein translocase subunit YajC [Candidatus Arthromitus sp. SFB-mouse]EIA21804.1 Preprotein translocase, YajC subunit [Candidatus Arthromitus sp. SFB-3]EIA22346.1 Preprotein translocase, YajC subunit [Candidatus Arthromitus sp. SFB-1]EIA24895.1 Preprotein translocase, YajC subunit [Candidatus Arthromitus sp. SFB-2]EIA27312.1 Preprotein translocase, YajC subunit [Candidatus Arthromitus sp. SFB-co]EIA30235.1 Preprotein translocase, YajC subunit [Candidatus Arthromitus sp. SFB-4]EIA30906.
MSSFVNLLIPIGFLIILYVIMILPETRRRKKYQSMLDNIKVNDKVITRGGVVAKVISIDNDKNEVVLETAPDRTRMTFLKNSIGTIVVESVEKIDIKSDNS